MDICEWRKWIIIFFKNEGVYQNSYRLASRTSAVLFDPRTDLLPSACGFGQQIRPRVKQNRCCPRTQSITVYYFLWMKYAIHFVNDEKETYMVSATSWKLRRFCPILRELLPTYINRVNKRQLINLKVNIVCCFPTNRVQNNQPTNKQTGNLQWYWINTIFKKVLENCGTIIQIVQILASIKNSVNNKIST